MATRAEWAERVVRWERSGLSAEKFAPREGYKPKQLYWSGADERPQHEEERPMGMIEQPLQSPPVRC